MKFIKTHIIFLLTVIGFLTTTVQVTHSLNPTSFLIETEIEESFDYEIESSAVWKDKSIEKYDDGGSIAIINFVESFFSIVNFDFTNLHLTESKPLSNKVAYFILYCCLKINC